MTVRPFIFGIEFITKVQPQNMALNIIDSAISKSLQRGVLWGNIWSVLKLPAPFFSSSKDFFYTIPMIWPRHPHLSESCRFDAWDGTHLPSHNGGGCMTCGAFSSLPMSSPQHTNAGKDVVTYVCSEGTGSPLRGRFITAIIQSWPSRILIHWVFLTPACSASRHTAD